MSNIKNILVKQVGYRTKNASMALNLPVCYYGNVALYDAELVYPEIAS